MASKEERDWYRNGCNNMIAEGITIANKILAYATANKDQLVNMTDDQKKKFMLEFDPSKQFNSVHPVVFQFLVLESIFNDKAFKRYINDVFGKERTQNPDKLEMYKQRSSEQAKYYFYLLQEFNPNVDKNLLYKQYEEMCNQTNKEIDHMFSVYKQAEEESKVDEEVLTEEKRQEVLQLLKQKLNNTD
jgi:hypothetical protein